MILTLSAELVSSLEGVIFGGFQIELAFVQLEDNSYTTLLTTDGGAGANFGAEFEFIVTENTTLGSLLGPSTEISGGYGLGIEISVPGHVNPGELLREIALNGRPSDAYGSVTLGLGGGIFVGHNETSELLEAVKAGLVTLFNRLTVELPDYMNSPSCPFHDIRSMAEIEGWGVEGWSVEPWQDAYDQFQFAAPFTTPLVLALDGDGIELTSVNGATAFFDVGVDGFAEATGWVAADDGLLVLDVDGNGRIDNGSELFGDQTGHAHGFLALAQHDDNGDGVIDASDTVFGQLRIWQDLNQEGISQASEMRSLADVGISSISVQSTTTSYWVAGNETRYDSIFTWDDGRVGVVGDAFFASDKIRTKAILADDFEYHSDVFKLPVLAGVGHLAHVASHSSQCRNWL
ncbi:hypothetical protein [Roseinatronobacter sp.]|uniref:hypothetical protein n=1 Tax=Roseinatronobacter sp. TaxID=1945755 RepID=UPI0025F2FF50|nr:hypothetical protein [Roseibaca sp.]